MTSHCSVQTLESALAGSLSAEEEARLYQHLESCQACSAALEELAGGSAWCQQAATLLGRQRVEPEASLTEHWSEADFTVEHLEPADDPKLLGRLGGYDVLAMIGHGGMGVVLKAFDRELKRLVAIKVLAPHLAQNSLARKRFAREAQAAAAVVHPNVLAIHQVQPGGKLPFLVMPLVAGESLAERLKTEGVLQLKEILRIGMQAASGLAAAHEQGLVHRDVKPANILLEKGVERAVLTDFGLARAADDVTLTRWGVIAGTPQYMSPEQARGEPLDGRSDLFSLGSVLYEMATGVSPFGSDSVMATIRRLVDDPPQAMVSLNPELPRWFVALVDRLLEKDPSRRFSSANEVSELLEGCLAHVQQPANVPVPAGLSDAAAPRDWRPHLRTKGLMTMISALAIGLFGAVLVASNPPDIAGPWTGEAWAAISLTKVSDTQYTGTYRRTTDGKPGEIHLKWSRIERRYNGTWSEKPSLAFTPGADALIVGTEQSAHGRLSLRLVGDEIRGARTTDAKSAARDASAPRLADLTWRRATAGKKSVPDNAVGSAILIGDNEINLFARPATSVLELRRLMETTGVLSGSRREAAEQLLERLTKLFNRYELLLIDHEKKDPLVVELKTNIQEVALTLIGLCVHTSSNTESPIHIGAASLRVQQCKANLQVAAAAVLRAEAHLAECESKQKLAEKHYQMARELREQKVYNEVSVEAVRIDWESAKAAVVVARAELKAAQATASVRAEQLRETENELQAAQQELAKRRANASSTEAANSPSRATTRRVNVQHATAGKLTDARDFIGQLVARDGVESGQDPNHAKPLKSIGLRFQMDQRTYMRYQELVQAGKIEKVGDTFAAGLATEENLPRSATLVYFDSQFNPETGSIGAMCTLPNPQGVLLPGMLVRVRVDLGPPRSILALPLAAVEEEANAAYVWVVNDKNMVERRLVHGERSPDDDNAYVVFEGLKGQDRVILGDKHGLKPGERVEPRPQNPDTGTPTTERATPRAPSEPPQPQGQK